MGQGLGRQAPCRLCLSNLLPSQQRVRSTTTSSGFGSPALDLHLELLELSPVLGGNACGCVVEHGAG